MATSSKPETDIARRDVLTLFGTAAAGLAVPGPAVAQSAAPANGPAPVLPQGKSTISLDRLPTGVLLIGIDRVEAQNRIDIPTFNALGQAYYEFEHDNDLRVAVLHGKGPDFSQGLDLQSWGAGLRAGPFQTSRRSARPGTAAKPWRRRSQRSALSPPMCAISRSRMSTPIMSAMSRNSPTLS
jgi:enoyl-CoA hydratase